MELHTALWDDVSAFDFKSVDLLPLMQAWPSLEVVQHAHTDTLLNDPASIELLATWKFEAAWYELFPNLKAIFTPAAGTDWIAPAPANRVAIHHGTFHGPILAESLLGAILHMNRRMPALLDSIEAGQWDRNLQADTRLLANQTVVIIGLGHIGSACAALLKRVGAQVIGVKRTASRRPGQPRDVEVITVDKLQSALAIADHAILLLPGGSSTDRFLNRQRLQQLKKGAFVYNFGRGNSLLSEDLLPVLREGHLRGAFLDVTEKEPLPEDSPLRAEPNVVITPHSSCVCSEYKGLFIDELIAVLSTYLA